MKIVYIELESADAGLHNQSRLHRHRCWQVCTLTPGVHVTVPRSDHEARSFN